MLKPMDGVIPCRLEMQAKLDMHIGACSQKIRVNLEKGCAIRYNSKRNLTAHYAVLRNHPLNDCVAGNFYGEWLALTNE